MSIKSWSQQVSAEEEKKSLQSVIDKAKAYIEADHIDLKRYRIGLECGLDKKKNSLNLKNR